jgi:hypothetical protein
LGTVASGGRRSRVENPFGVSKKALHKSLFGRRRRVFRWYFLVFEGRPED